MNYTYLGSGKTLISNGDLELICGFEMGDWLSYVSAGRDATSATHKVTGEELSDDAISIKQRVDLEESSFQVEQHESITGERIDRSFVVSPHHHGVLGDFVARFAVPASDDMVAAIGGKVFEHRGQNRYLQFRDDTAELRGDTGTVIVETSAAELPENMVLVMYVRDEPPDTWVIHARAIAVGSDDGILRFYRGQTAHMPILDSSVQRCDWLADHLRYLRERSRIPSSLIPIQYCERTLLPEDDQLRITVRAQFET